MRGWQPRELWPRRRTRPGGGAVFRGRSGRLEVHDKHLATELAPCVEAELRFVLDREALDTRRELAEKGDAVGMDCERSEMGHEGACWGRVAHERAPVVYPAADALL